MSSLWPSWLPLRDDLRDQIAYGAPQLEVPVRLNTNENPFGPSKSLVKDLEHALSEIGTHLNRYPDRNSMTLRQSLARYINETSDTTFTAENIWPANGSNEVIQSLFLAFAGNSKVAAGFEPSYSMHRNIAKVTGTSWHSWERRDDYSIDVNHVKERASEVRATLIFLTTPNNPTGTITSVADIRQLAEISGRTGALLVIDEAYQEFSAQPSAVTLIDEFPHVVVSRTMSKAFAFAGTRVGYLVGNAKVIDALQLVRLPYHLSSATQAFALVALDHSQELLANVALLRQERERVRAALTRMGVNSLESGANFFLFSAQNPGKLWQKLVDVGVLVRDVGLPSYLRVTIGTPEENDHFLAAIKDALGESSTG